MIWFVVVSGLIAFAFSWSVVEYAVKGVWQGTEGTPYPILLDLHAFLALVVLALLFTQPVLGFLGVGLNFSKATTVHRHLGRSLLVIAIVSFFFGVAETLTRHATGEFPPQQAVSVLLTAVFTIYYYIYARIEIRRGNLDSHIHNNAFATLFVAAPAMVRVVWIVNGIVGLPPRGTEGYIEVLGTQYPIISVVLSAASLLSLSIWLVYAVGRGIVLSHPIKSIIAFSFSGLILASTFFKGIP